MAKRDRSQLSQAINQLSPRWTTSRSSEEHDSPASRQGFCCFLGRFNSCAIWSPIVHSQREPQRYHQCLGIWEMTPWDGDLRHPALPASSKAGLETQLPEVLLKLLEEVMANILALLCRLTVKDTTRYIWCMYHIHDTGQRQMVSVKDFYYGENQELRKRGFD